MRHGTSEKSVLIDMGCSSTIVAIGQRGERTMLSLGTNRGLAVRTMTAGLGNEVSSGTLSSFDSGFCTWSFGQLREHWLPKLPAP